MMDDDTQHKQIEPTTPAAHSHEDKETDWLPSAYFRGDETTDWKIPIPPPPPPMPRKRRRWLLLALAPVLLALLIAGAAGGYVFFQGAQKMQRVVQTAAPHSTTQPTSAPTA